jgi:hypothetical protein
VEQAGLAPVVTHYERGFTGFRVIPLYAYTDELAARHGGAEISLPFFKNLAETILQEGMLQEKPPL